MPPQFLNSLQNFINLNYILYHDIQNSDNKEFVIKEKFFFLLILRILTAYLDKEIAENLNVRMKRYGKNIKK
jgi:hypothetical protein